MKQFSAPLYGAESGLTVGYRVVDVDQSEVLAYTTAGVIERALGDDISNYFTPLLSLDDDAHLLIWHEDDAGAAGAELGQDLVIAQPVAPSSLTAQQVREEMDSNSERFAAIQEQTDRFADVGDGSAPLEPVPVPDAPNMVYVRCTADKPKVKFTLTPVDNEKDFIADEYRSKRNYSGYTAETENGFEVLIEVPPSSVLSDSGFNPATYEVTSNDDAIGTITVPDEGGNLKTLLEAAA
jgi:hypothetical protein